MAAKIPPLRVIKGGASDHLPATLSPSGANIVFDRQTIMDSFADNITRYGITLLKSHSVARCETAPYQPDTHKQSIQGVVRDRRYPKPLRVSMTAKVDIDDDEEEGNAEILVLLHSTCSCRDEDCVHAAALALYAIGTHTYTSPTRTQPVDAYQLLLTQSKQQTHASRDTDKTIASWSRELHSYRAPSTTPRTGPDEGIVYLLDCPHNGAKLRLTVEKARHLKRGGYGKSKTLLLDDPQTKALMSDEDKAIFAKIYPLQDSPSLSQSSFQFFLQSCDALFHELLNSGKLYWRQTSRHPLSLGKAQSLTPRWVIDESGNQSFQLYDSESDHPITLTLLPTQPLWYYDAQTGHIGPIEVDLSADVVVWLTRLPDVTPHQIPAVKKQLKTMWPDIKQLPSLHTLTRATLERVTSPLVKLRLYGQTFEFIPEGTDAPWEHSSPTTESPQDFISHLVHQFLYSDADELYEDTEESTLALAECQFDYEGKLVSLSNPDDQLEFYADGKLYTLHRDRSFERACVEKLSQAGLEPAARHPNWIEADESIRCSFVINDMEDDEAAIAEQLSSLQSLAAQEEWELVIDASFPTRVIHEVDEWYTELEENNSGIDWFSLGIGVMLKGERVNILPLLIEQLKHQFHGLNATEIEKLPDHTPCELRMDNGEYLSIPFPRVRNIVLVLCELFEKKPLDDEGKLQLSRFKASLLPEIERAVGATRLRWLGETKLKKLGEKFADFDRITIVPPAKAFNAILRPYQQDGLNWLQFLREYQLNGILADDMGLGKTIQTLAHLTVEKSDGRLTEPSLLITPTSLVSNWEREATRFAPSLSCLVLHGDKRKEEFERIPQVDLVISTYPLVVRDKTTLLKHTYQFLILDEAQQIKNSQAKVTQIILQMQAKHRLCLTGTPMENHLGELWSLFHFLLPGLLGTKSQFGHLFRGPIEREGDKNRHQQLIQRIKPFMLRRRKDDVLEDLPSKTEVIRTVSLGQAQRDLYESVRLAMEQRVQKTIKAQGIKSSQIIILDALLKMRQICCSPALLSLAPAKKVQESAKLDDLMVFLPELLEEGRRILLFSSFSSMLKLIAERLTKMNLPYVQLTGQTKDRKTPIDSFQNRKVPLFLISLKAGGIGLNLTSADTVIHYDPWWNPAAEQQATDRAHRIGQKHPVFVYKMVVEGSVEECILTMQAKKREIIDSTLDGSKQTKLSLTQKDLQALFKPWV